MLYVFSCGDVVVMVVVDVIHIVFATVSRVYFTKVLISTDVMAVFKSPILSAGPILATTDLVYSSCTRPFVSSQSYFSGLVSSLF